MCESKNRRVWKMLARGQSGKVSVAGKPEWKCQYCIIDESAKVSIVGQREKVSIVGQSGKVSVIGENGKVGIAGQRRKVTAVGKPEWKCQYCIIDESAKVSIVGQREKVSIVGQGGKVAIVNQSGKVSVEGQSANCSGHGTRCFASGPRKSNESQCPMLQKLEKPIPSTTTTPPMTSTKSTIVRNHLNSTCSVTNSPHQKKLRFHLAKERKASTTLGIIMSAFTICWLPFFVLALVKPFRDAIPPFLSSLFLWLGYCNSLLNPIIYATLNRDFRKPFREILYFRCSNLNHMMREEFYQSQYGDPINNYEIKAGEMDGDERLDNQGIEAIDVGANAPNESFL
ncbi:5-hydroxytryptamine receptor 1 [Habropoda laboriosa]|uniref:5-hydroxytryptamine receptor 1 n=1 Tax=Habropoda laboriosa TaxID=597456 RepID=A0A0L7QV41_9HYME|nr:5-hydroxytryptamine receptor 1 [Habropoda laboriosa]